MTVHGSVLFGVLLGLAALSCGCQPVKEPGAREASFHRGRQAVMDGDYETAIAYLDEYLGAESPGRFDSRAGLFLGKAQLGAGDLDAAQQAFQRTLELFPDSLEAGKCRYKLALIELLRGERDAARESFGRVATESGALRAEGRAMQEFLGR